MKKGKPVFTVMSGLPEKVIDSLIDPERFCPIFAGTAIIKRNKLIIHLLQHTIEINGPMGLMSEILEICDGTQTLAQILTLFNSKKKSAELKQGLDFLFTQGVLIDAADYCLAMQRYAYQTSPFGISAEKTLTNQISLRHYLNDKTNTRLSTISDKKIQEEAFQGSLLESWQQRRSCPIFDEKAISEQQLLALLWAVYGVVEKDLSSEQSSTYKRTLGSGGGMYLFEVYVFLNQEVGAYAKGLYRVQYSNALQVYLERVNNDAEETLALIYSKPWETKFATGALFLLGDAEIAALRYRNRSLQYMFMEAGAALHNGALAAANLQIGYSIIGGYYEEPIKEICQMERGEVFATALFGALPTQDQKLAAQQQPEYSFSWINLEQTTHQSKHYYCWTSIQLPDDTSSSNKSEGWGYARSPMLAERKALAEAIERQGFSEPKNLVCGKMSEIEHALDPRDFVRYADFQYQNADFPLKQFCKNASALWAKGTNILSGKSVHVLADLIYSGDSLRKRQSYRASYTHANTSGCAAGEDITSAFERALFELVERDAFMRHWLQQTPGVGIDIESLPSELRRRVHCISEMGHEKISIQYLPSRWAPVCLASVQHTAKHMTFLGAASSNSLEAAIDAALDELEARALYVELNPPDIQIKQPRKVETPEHHLGLYYLKAYFQKADPILFCETSSHFSQANRVCGQVSDLLEKFIAQGIAPIQLDITPEKSYVDQGRTKLHVVRAFVSSLIPMSFGYGLEPRGFFEKTHPASKFPHPFP